MAKHAASTVTTTRPVVLRPVVVSSAEAYIGRLRIQAPSGRHARV